MRKPMKSWTWTACYRDGAYPFYPATLTGCVGWIPLDRLLPRCPSRRLEPGQSPSPSPARTGVRAP